MHGLYCALSFYHEAFENKKSEKLDVLSFKKTVRAIMRDVIQFKLNAKATLKAGAKLK